MIKSNIKRSICASVLATALIAPAAVAAQQVHNETWANGVERSLVYCPGDFDSKFYRIPAIVTAKDGSLVTVADKRIEHNGDLPAKIDVVSDLCYPLTALSLPH